MSDALRAARDEVARFNEYADTGAPVDRNVGRVMSVLSDLIESIDSRKAEPMDHATPVGVAWADYYRPGMSPKEARAFKAGFFAASQT